MIRDLLTYLIIHEVEQLTAPSLPPDQIENHVHLLEEYLASSKEPPKERSIGCSPDEWRILSQYLRLDLTELDALSGPTHLWFLERLCWTPEVMAEIGHEVVVRLYFLGARPPVRCLVVSALLALDAWTLSGRNQRSQSYVAGVWEAIIGDGGLTPQQQGQMLEELADLLIDLSETEHTATDAALLGLIQSERQSSVDERRLPRHLAIRAEHFGGDFARRLRDIASHY